MAKLIHAMFRVLDEARSLDFYRRAFGLEVSSRCDFETFTLIYLRNAENDFEVELTVNKGRSEPYDLGNGYGHLAFCVEDLDAEHARFDAEKLNPGRLSELKQNGEMMARFFFVQDPDGYKIEVLQRFGHYV